MATKALAAQVSSLPYVLGRYELLGVLGRGGMATVYLARLAAEPGARRLYALKVMHPHLADEPECVRMLGEEAHIGARLHHPNVVPVVDLGVYDGVNYVVLEYVEGFALWSLLDKCPKDRPPRLLVPIVLDALAGLHAAHSLADARGRPLRVVHRDVSPQNVIVGSDGNARLIDFGVAKLEPGAHNTRPGQVKGKLAFMSPEQLRGEESVDARSDVFAAGVLLWSALTGRELFQAGSDAMTMSNVISMRIPPPSTVGLRPPDAFDAVCLRALERSPTRRWQSARDFEEALGAAAFASGMLARSSEVGAWVARAFATELTERRRLVAEAAERGPLLAKSTELKSSGFRVRSTSEHIDIDIDDEDLQDALVLETADAITMPPPPNYDAWAAKADAPTLPEPTKRTRRPTI